MTRSQSLGKEEAGVLGLREEEGPRRKDEEAEQSRQDAGQGWLGGGFHHWKISNIEWLMNLGC